MKLSNSALSQPLPGGRAQLNGAVYYQLFHDFIGFGEDLLVDVNGDRLPDTRMTSLAFNAEATGLITQHWQVATSISYSDFTFDEGGRGLCSDLAQFANNTPGGADNVQLATCEIGG